MKRMLAMLLAVTMTMSLTACGAAADSKETSKTEIVGETTKAGEESAIGATKIIVDQEGTEMEIPVDIDRVVVAAWQMAAPLAAYLGGGEKIVGMAPASMSAAENGVIGQIYPEILNASTDFYEGGTINIEELLKLDPDIVIGVSGEAAESIRDAGIPAVAVSVSNWDYDVVETSGTWLQLFNDIFGENEKALAVQEYAEQVEAMIAERVSVLSEEERKSVMTLFTYSDATMTTSGKMFFGQSWCDLTGSMNVGEEIEAAGSASINMEQVYAWNPDVIMITNFTTAQPDDLYNNTIGSDDWSTVAAVQNKEVYKMPLGWYRSYTPGVDTAVTLQWYAKMIYPELFEDVDIEQVAKDYFLNYFDVELTDEQIDFMFNPPSSASAY